MSLIKYDMRDLQSFFWNGLFMTGDFSVWDDPAWHAKQAEEARQDARRRNERAQIAEKNRERRAAKRQWKAQLEYIMGEVRRRELQLASWEDEP